MRADDIDALLATVQFLPLNQIAEYLGITQSTTTRRPQHLEQELNVTLLECQARPLTLTAVGHRVCEQCLSIKRETKRLYSLLDPQGKLRGVLRLGVPQSLSETALSATLSVLNWQFPGLSLQITCGQSEQPQCQLENDELDDILAMGSAQQSLAEGYSGHLLHLLEVVPIVGRHLNSRASSLRECAEQGWILDPDDCGLCAGLIREPQSQGLRLKLNVEGVGTQLQVVLVAQELGPDLAPRAVPANSP